MSEVLEQIKSEIAQLTATVKEHQADKATLDTDRLAAAVEGMVQRQVNEKLTEADRNRPIRKGEIIGPPGFERLSGGVVPNGRFEGKQVDDVVFAHWLLSRAQKIRPDSVKAPSKEMTEIVSKALSSTGSTSGDEYVPTGMAAVLWNDMFLASKVVNTIGIIPMPTDPFDIPLGWGATTWRKGTQNTATTATDVATAKSTLTSTEQITEIDWSYDLDEDAVIAVLPTLRQELGRSGADQMDAFVLNADATNAGTGNINLDDADPADDSYYLTAGQDGIRHLYIVDNTAQSTDINAVLSDTNLRAGIGRLGKYAADVSRLVMVTDPKTYVNNMLGMTNIATVDKYGPQATILTGELMRYGGIPVIVSSQMAEAEDDGKVSTTAGNNDEGQIAIFHRDMWKVGFRRQLLIEIDRLIQKRQMVMVVSFRIAVAARGTRSTATHTAGVHGIVRN
jgi:HK97 family phage major capsid protein